MAAVQISGAVWPAAITGRLGPFADSSGNLWVFALDSTPHVVAYKSSDGGVTWGTTYATSGTYGNFSLDCVYDGSDTVYVLVQDASNVLNILSFTLSTHTWADLYVSGTKPAALADVNSRFPAFLVRRSTGEIVVSYQSALHSTTFRSISYARFSTAGAWSAAVRVDQNNATIHYSLKGMVLGASDRVHFAYIQSNSTAISRSISSANSIDTAQTAGSGGNVAETTFNAIFYDAAVGLVWGFNSQTTNLRFPYRATSGANATWTADANQISANLAISTGTGSSVAFAYDSANSKLWGAFQGAGSDVYYNSAAVAGTTWGTEALLDAATAAKGFSMTKSGFGLHVAYGDSGVFYDHIGNISIPAAVAGTSTTTASYRVSVGKTLSVAMAATTASIVKSAGKTLSVSLPAAAASAIKSIGKSVVGAATSTGSVTRSVGATVSAAVQATAIVAKTVTHTVAATAAAAASLVKETGKAVNGAVTLSADLSRTVATTVVATVSTVADLAMTRAIGVALAATVQASAVVVKAIDSTVSALCSATGEIAKGMAVDLAATATAAADITKTIAATLSATVSAAASIVTPVAQLFTQTLTAGVTTVATLTRTVILYLIGGGEIIAATSGDLGGASAGRIVPPDDGTIA